MKETKSEQCDFPTIFQVFKGISIYQIVTKAHGSFLYDENLKQLLEKKLFGKPTCSHDQNLTQQKD